jgi:hypothetical protein
VKLLYVYGEDYAATEFERVRDAKAVNPAELWQWHKASPDNHYLEHFDTDGTRLFEYRALEFSDVDPKFLEFVRDDLRDYDDTKHAGIYVIEGTDG